MAELPAERLEREAEACTKKPGNFITRFFMHPDYARAAELYVQAAHAYGNTNKYEKAAELFQKAGEILLQENQEEMAYDAASMFVKSAETFYLVDKGKCIEAYRRAFEINTRRIMDFPMAGMIAVKIARTYKELADYPNALDFFYKAAEFYGNAQMRVTRRNNLISCAEIELKLKNYERVFALYRELALDDSVTYQTTESTLYLFISLLTGILLGRVKECYEMLNGMEHDRIEARIAYRILNIKSRKEEIDEDDLDRELNYYRNTNSISPEVASLLAEVRMSIDPEHDIL